MTTVPRPKEFSFNSERLSYLRALAANGETKLAKKLAWEWLTTKTFEKRDFDTLLDMWADIAAFNAIKDIVQ